MAACVVVCKAVDGGCVAFEHYFTAKSSGVRSYVNEVVRRTNYLFVVLYHYHRVVESLKLFEHMNEPLGVAAVQCDARFVDNVYRAYERTAERCCKIDAQALTSTERV